MLTPVMILFSVTQVISGTREVSGKVHSPGQAPAKYKQDETRRKQELSGN